MISLQIIFPDYSQGSRFQPRKAKIIARFLHFGHRKMETLTVATPGQLFNNGSTWIPQIKKFGDFVQAFAGRIVSGFAQQSVSQWLSRK